MLCCKLWYFPISLKFPSIYDKKFTHIAKSKKGIDDRMNYIFIIGELQMICSSVTAHGLQYLCSYFNIKTKTAIGFVFSGGVLSQSYHSTACVCMCVCLCARCTCVLDFFFYFIVDNSKIHQMPFGFKM